MQKMIGVAITAMLSLAMLFSACGNTVDDKDKGKVDTSRTAVTTAQNASTTKKDESKNKLESKIESLSSTLRAAVD